MWAETFWARVDQSGGPDACWPWTGSGDPAGYGTVYSPIRRRGLKTHRVAFALTFGYDPGFVCHTCDNPPCCNPAHLFAGSPAANVHDMVAKGRSGGGRPRGQTRGDSALLHERIAAIVNAYHTATGAAISVRELAGLIGLRPTATYNRLRRLAREGRVQRTGSRGFVPVTAGESSVAA